MKRLLLLSDIHGNLPALQAALDAVREDALDGIIAAGDLTGGPQPNETIRLLQEQGAWMIRGNTDENILRYVSGRAPALWQTSLQWAVMRWSLAELEKDLLDMLLSLPDQRVVALQETDSIRVVHGSPRSSSEGLHPERFPERLEAALAAAPEPVLVCGHTHVPWQRRVGGKLAVNPGSAAASLNGVPWAHYALLTWDGRRWQAEHHTAVYDLDQIRQAYEKSGLLEEGGALARAYLLANLHAYDVPQDFFALVRRLMIARGLEDMQTIPDEVWLEADLRFDWERWESGAPGSRGGSELV